MRAQSSEGCDNLTRMHALAEFRYHLRRFLHFSEQAALDQGLHPQQHQLLLQLAGAPGGTPTTIAYAAERLDLRHNSAVGLVDRCVAERLLIRTEDPSDRRKAVLSITPHGQSVLERLSNHHARELYELAPALLRSLRSIGRLEASRERANQGRP